MDRKTVYEDKNLRLEYVKNGNYLHETWMGVTLYDTFAKLEDQVSKFLHEFNADGVLLDARLHKGIGPEGQKYAVKNIGDYARYHGKFKEAIITPKDDVFSEFSVESFSQKVVENSPVQVKFFDTLESAEEWMREG